MLFLSLAYTNDLCNTLTPQIKGKCSATNLMLPCLPAQHHDVALEGGIPFL